MRTLLPCIGLWAMACESPVPSQAPPPTAPTTLSPVPLHHAEASSYLQTKGNRHVQNYHPYFVIDEAPATAWVEGVDGPGIGEQLTVALQAATGVGALRLELQNGYHKSAELLTANGAASKLRVEALHKGKPVGQTTGKLEREMGWQSIELAFKAPTDVDALRLTILAVHPGEKYEDTVITDLRVLSDGHWEPQPRLPEELQQWLDTRPKVAQGQADPMWKLWFSHFDKQAVDTKAADFESQLADVQAAQKKLADATWYRVPVPDVTSQPGDEPADIRMICAMPWSFDTIPAFLEPDTVRLGDSGPPIGTTWKLKRLFTARYDAAKPVDTAVATQTDTTKDNDEGWGNIDYTSHLRIAWHSKGVPAVAMERSAGEGCQSACDMYYTDRLVVFDTQGMPVLSYTHQVNAMGMGEWSLTPGSDGWPALQWESETATDKLMTYFDEQTLKRFDLRHGRIAAAMQWQHTISRDEDDDNTNETTKGWRFTGQR